MSKIKAGLKFELQRFRPQDKREQAWGSIGGLSRKPILCQLVGHLGPVKALLTYLQGVRR